MELEFEFELELEFDEELELEFEDEFELELDEELEFEFDEELELELEDELPATTIAPSDCAVRLMPAGSSGMTVGLVRACAAPVASAATPIVTVDASKVLRFMDVAPSR